MQLRDEGRLSLDDTLGRRSCPRSTHPGLTVRQCLAHVSGMQREPLGDVWETLVNPDRAELVSGFNEAERVHRPHQLWHYSNLVYSMLGEVVARARRPGLGRRRCRRGSSTRWRCGAPRWASTRAARARATTSRRTRRARAAEPLLDLRAMDPCGGLASTAADLARLVRVRGRPGRRGALARHARGDVRAAGRSSTASAGPPPWASASSWSAPAPAHVRRPHRRHARPHHGACSPTARAKTGGIALMNSTAAPDIAGFAIGAGRPRHRARPRRGGALATRGPTSRRSSRHPRRLVHRGRPFTFTVRGGRLEARADGPPRHNRPPSVRAGRSRRVPHGRRPRARASCCA